MVRSADMCYVGQSFDVNVPLPGTLEDVSLSDAIERFHQRHTSIYGHADPAAAVRLMTVRVQVVGATPKPQLGHIARDGADAHVPREPGVRESLRERSRVARTSLHPRGTPIGRLLSRSSHRRAVRHDDLCA